MAPGLFGYTIRRLLWAIPVLFVISAMVFWVLRIVPGDPVDTILGKKYDEETASRLRAKYGYDKPLVEQYTTYMANLFHGDLGVSTRHQDFSVSDVIVRKIWISSQIGFMGLVIAFALGIAVGIYAALARGTFLDPLVISFWLALDAIPIFVLITLSQWLFGLKLQLVGLGWQGVWNPNTALPVMILGLTGVAGTARVMRASVITVVGEDYVRTARAKGLKESTVVITHIMRNALLPLVTSIGLAIPGVTAGELFLERGFGIPGIGGESLEAALGSDYDVLMALVLFGATLFVLANIVVDVLYVLIDPRIRVGAARG